jgi:NAD-dependent dihydropyrimidine dehydrogenase PreA subunit
LVRVIFRFDKETVDKPITSQVILEHGVSINILSAHMSQQGGEILADIDTRSAEKVIRAFREKGVTVDVRRLIEKDDELCVDCGGCVSICPMDALTFDEKRAVILYEEQCNGVTCGLCVDACPQRALRLIG